MRVLMRRLHLWLGLSLGLLFALIGLTGSALVFYTAIDAELNPAVKAGHTEPAPSWGSPIWDRALATGRAARPDTADQWPGNKWTFEVTGEGGSIPARHYSGPSQHRTMEMLWFSSDGTRILRAQLWGDYLMSWIYRLHMELLAGEAGLQIVGWSGVAMLLLLVSGLWAWWPRGSWRKALAFKRNAAPIRRLHDLHKLPGIWSMALLAILAATGTLLALPNVTQALLSPTPIAAPPLSPRSPPRQANHGRSPITITQAMASARAALPDGRPVFIDISTADDAPIRVRFQVPDDPHARFPGSYVFIDRYSARVVAVHDIRNSNTGAAVSSWVRPLHDGTIGGLTTRILAFMLGLVPTVLLVTGVLHWITRRRTLARGGRR